MKSNRKDILEQDEAVSTVISVILMVAVTVAVASTVFVIVSGMSSDIQKKTPIVVMMPDNEKKRINIVNSDGDCDWTDFGIQASVQCFGNHSDNPTATPNSISTKGAVIGTDIWSTGASWDTNGMVNAGDYIQLSGDGPIVIMLIYIPSNTISSSVTVDL